MGYFPLSGLINALTSLFLGFYVLFNNKKNPLNITFSYFAFSASLWSFFYFLWQLSSDYEMALLFSRIFMLGAILIPATHFHFVTVLLRVSDKLKKTLWLSYLACFFFLLSDATPLMISGLEPRLFFRFWPIPGILFDPFLFCYFFGLVAYSHILMSREIFSARTSKTFKNQIVYIFWGTLIGFLGGSTNFLLWYNIPVPPWGNILVIAYVITVAYAIVKHRLLAIEVIVQKSFVYTITSILIISFYVVGVYLSEQFLQAFFGYTSVLATAFLVFVIAALFQPLLKRVQGLADRIFVRHRFDYQRALRSVSQDILSRIKLEDVAQLIVSTFIEVVEISEISFLVFNRKNDSFQSVDLHIKEGLGKYKKIELSSGNNLAVFFLQHPGPLSIEALQEEVARRESEGDKEGVKEPTKILSEVYPFEFKLWVPVIGKNGLAAIIALGEKASREAFSAEDLRLFSTLANQTALSLENVRLYQEVMEMKNYNQEVLDSLPSGVLTTNQEGKIITCNPAMEKIIGKKYEELEGKKYSDVFSEKSPLFGAVASTLKDKCLYNFEAGILNPRKGIVPLLINTTLLGTPRDKTGMLLSARDMTEVRDLENKARQADKLKALGIMSAGMAHEIKNPLSSLRIMAQIIPLKFDDPAFRKKMLEIIPTEVGRIDRIVENLLRFARTTEMKLAKVNIGEYLDSILKDYLKQAEESRVAIVKNYSRLPEIMLDPEQFTQVFTNLILNAIQAMPEGGTLLLTTKIGRQLENFIQGITIEISDTGHGISEENLAHLFDPFFTTKHGGTGLGLTIVHSLVEAHQGEIKVLSKIGEGTTFRIYLPVQQ